MVTAEVPVRIELRGGNWQAYNATEREFLVEGGAGTGKSFACLLRLNRHAQEHPGYHGAIIRKTAVTLAGTVLRTFEEEVLHEWNKATRHSNLDHVHFFGGSQNEPAAYEYDNGSTIIVGGMDNPSKVLSTDYDEVYYNEATEGSLEDWETLLGRLRHNVLPQRSLFGDCNPAHQGHWLLQRCLDGRCRRIRTLLKDNPAYWQDDAWTELGREYEATLAGMTGTRRQRFFLGEWVGQEDAIYPAFDRSLHVKPLEPGLRLETVLGVDYGRAHLSAVVALSRDQYGRRWVREAWAEVDQDGGKSIMRTIGAMRQQYTVARGRVDPNQGFLGGQAGFNIAKGSAGSRMHRIDLMEPLFYSYPGGRVPTLGQEFNQALPHGPYAESDSPGILFVEGAPGIEELCSEIEAYHYVWTETPKGKTKDVYRVDENRIAALEYAAEELSEGADYTSLLTARAALLRR